MAKKIKPLIKNKSNVALYWVFSLLFLLPIFLLGLLVIRLAETKKTGEERRLIYNRWAQICTGISATFLILGFISYLPTVLN